MSNNKPIKNKNTDIINYDIKASEMLVIASDGSKLGLLSRKAALSLAEESNLDLLLVSPNLNPPVAKLVDHGKYKYEQKKRNRETKKNQHFVENKEMRLRTGIGDHDLEFKAKKVREFLEEGSRVKISLKFRGREVARPEYGHETLKKFFSYFEDIAKVEKEPVLNGLFLDMYVVPNKLKGENKNAKNENEKITG